MSSTSRMAVAASVLATFTPASSATMAQQAGPTAHAPVELVEEANNAFICIFNPTRRPEHVPARAAALAARYGGTVTHTYTRAIRGFAAALPARAGARLAAQNADVDYCEADGVVSAFGAWRQCKAPQSARWRRWREPRPDYPVGHQPHRRPRQRRRAPGVGDRHRHRPRPSGPQRRSRLQRELRDAGQEFAGGRPRPRYARGRHHRRSRQRDRRRGRRGGSDPVRGPGARQQRQRPRELDRRRRRSRGPIRRSGRRREPEFGWLRALAEFARRDREHCGRRHPLRHRRRQ